MRWIAFFLICTMLFSCMTSSPEAEIQKKLSRLREIKKEHQMRLKSLKKLESIYRLRGKSSRQVTRNFTEGLISYLLYLIERAPEVRSELSWLEKKRIDAKLLLSPCLTGGNNIEMRTKNMAKGIWDVRMYRKRVKNLETRLRKKERVSQNAIKHIKYPL